MARLGVNVDHIATLRQARRTDYPDPVEAALLAESAGAEGITVHLREDRRHIQDRDVRLLREVVKTKLNLEMAPTQEMIRFALELKPDTVTLVPENREELTTEGGLDVVVHQEKIQKYVTMLQEAHIVASLFIDPLSDQIRTAHRCGARALELNTGRYCEAGTASTKFEELQKIQDAAKVIARLNVHLCAGHGLHYHNIQPVAAIGEIDEFNIGHSIVARAAMVGMVQAVQDMVSALRVAA